MVQTTEELKALIQILLLLHNKHTQLLRFSVAGLVRYVDMVKISCNYS